MRNRKPIYAILALGLAMLACATLTVTNSSKDHNAVIRVTLPDDAFGTIKLGPGESIDYTATTGGAYTVEVIPDQEYLATLQSLRDGLVAAMALNPILPLGSDGDILFLKLANLQAEIDALPRTGTKCSGSIPKDAPDGYTVEVNISYDANQVQWSCTAAAGQGSQ
jgi:hypothetical protein